MSDNSHEEQNSVTMIIPGHSGLTVIFVEENPEAQNTEPLKPEPLKPAADITAILHPSLQQREIEVISRLNGKMGRAGDPEPSRPVTAGGQATGQDDKFIGTIDALLSPMGRPSPL